MFSKKNSMNLIGKKGGYILLGKKSGGKPTPTVKQIIPGAYQKSPLEK